MNIKRTLKFELANRKINGVLPTEDILIRLRIQYAGQRIHILTGCRINTDQWGDEKVIKGAVNKSKQTAKAINAILGEYAKYIDDIFSRFEVVEKRIPTTREVLSLFNEMAGKKKIEAIKPEKHFFETFDLFTKESGIEKSWASATYLMFDKLKTLISNFDPKTSFETITENYLQRFSTFLKEADKRTKKIAYKNVTTRNYISETKWFLRWAVKKGFYKGNAHLVFNPKYKGTDGNNKEVIFLTWDELQTLINYKFTPDEYYLEQIRDVFAFCCFTGLRHCDVSRLTRSDVKQGFIQITTLKTTNGLKIELNRYSKAILDKYKDTPFPKGLALPVSCLVNMNNFLKTIARKCKFNTPTKIVYFMGSERIEEIRPKHTLITTHTARKSFIVNALTLGIPAEIIMQFTGHSSFSAMKPYFKIVDELKVASMEKFNLR